MSFKEHSVRFLVVDVETTTPRISTARKKKNYVQHYSLSVTVVKFLVESVMAASGPVFCL